MPHTSQVEQEDSYIFPTQEIYLYMFKLLTASPILFTRGIKNR